MVKQISESEFDEAVKSGVSAVDFSAVWCGPCKMLGPVVAEIAEEHPEIKVCKVNVDDEDELAQQFGVMSIPFVAVFKGGNLVKSTVGFQSKEALLNLI